MIKIIVIISLILTISCSEKKNNVRTSEPVVKKKTITTGWENNNIYIVKVTSTSVDSAIDMAKHKILKDVVKVRILNESRFTDIKLISSEFDPILKNGKVIKKEEIQGSVRIFFKIEDKNLKDKFRRK